MMACWPRRSLDRQPGQVDQLHVRVVTSARGNGPADHSCAVDDRSAPTGEDAAWQMLLSPANIAV
jgi:hypothetical protein